VYLAFFLLMTEMGGILNHIFYRDEGEVDKFSNTKAVEILVNSKLNVREQ